MAVDVDRQRMLITPVLRLVFSLTSLVDTSDYMEVGFCAPFIFLADTLLVFLIISSVIYSIYKTFVLV